MNENYGKNMTQAVFLKHNYGENGWIVLTYSIYIRFSEKKPADFHSKLFTGE